MRRNLTLAVWLLATMALALIGATAAAANPHTTYTCTKTKNNGQTDVKTSVPEPSLGGLTNAGYTCVAEAPPAEDEVQEEDEVQTTKSRTTKSRKRTKSRTTKSRKRTKSRTKPKAKHESRVRATTPCQRRTPNPRRG